MALRTRAAAAVLVLLSGVASAHYLQVWASVSQEQARTSDFAGSYAAAVLLRSGQAASMYDVPREEAVLAANGTPSFHLYIPFENPPVAAAVALPFSLAGASGAYWLWSLLQLALLIAAVVVAARAAPWPSSRSRMQTIAVAGVAIAGFGTGLLFVEGQWDGVLALAVALAYSGWRSGSRVMPGLVLGFAAALTKPHLVAGIVLFMAGRREWRGLAAGSAGAAVATAAGVVAAGPGALAAFAHALLDPANSPTATMQGASGIAGSLVGGGLAPFLISLAISAAAAAAAGWLGAVSRRRTDLFEPAFLAAVALSLFASPHLLGHDLTLLAPALVAALVWAMGHEAAAGQPWPGTLSLALLGGWVAVNGASLFDLGQMGVGFPGRLTPWVLGAACGALVAVVRFTLSGGRSARPGVSSASATLAARC